MLLDPFLYDFVADHQRALREAAERGRCRGEGAVGWWRLALGMSAATEARRVPSAADPEKSWNQRTPTPATNFAGDRRRALRDPSGIGSRPGLRHSQSRRIRPHESWTGPRRYPRARRCLRPHCERAREVDDVGGDDRPASSRRLRELRVVVELDPAHLVRAHRIDTLVAQEPRNNRRHVLVEVDLHSVVTKRTSPGYRCSIASGVNAALRAISRWISSG